MPTNYFNQKVFTGPLTRTSPSADLGLTVVIPACHELALINTLESLHSCHRTLCAVEVLVVINHSENASEQIKSVSRKTFEEAVNWAKVSSSDKLTFIPLFLPDLPEKRAGVGLARKIGMDEAARRALRVAVPEMPIICLDADCTCSPDYLVSLEAFFLADERREGCAVYFEHPLAGLEETHLKAIIDYELHLRCMIGWQRWAGFPFAYQTVGSSMAVRASVYLAVGGMNTRQAGEDFYFLHKVIERGRFEDCTSCTVYPSSRVSDRVPFGTGRAMLGALNGHGIKTYHPDTYRVLREWCTVIPKLYKENDRVEQLPEPIRDFLTTQNWIAKFEEIRKNTASQVAFTKRMFSWFNAFRFMKFAHYARDNYFPDIDVSLSCIQLAAESGVLMADATNEELLRQMRVWAKSGD